MIKTFFLIISFLSLSIGYSFSQADSTKSTFMMPLSAIQGITGSFGEVRTDHFHSGVDLRTENKIGKEVRATNDGYVSRINVSSTGFGKAIFIDHPNGLTTVYAHLDRYSDPINSYLKKIQYQRKTFSLDIFPKPTEIRVKKGDLLGYSGNSGGSSGPHLHYEVRTSIDQRPLNPIPYFLKIVDSIPPIIKSLYLFRIDSLSYANGYARKSDINVIKNQNEFLIDGKINACGRIGIGVDAFDRVNNQSTICGFKSISLTVNNKLVYLLLLDQFSFAETKYVNSVIDYATKYSSGKEIVKLYADPCNFFSGLHNLDHKGILTIKPDSLYHIVIDVTDASNNLSKLIFSINGITPPNKPESIRNSRNNTILLSCMMENTVINDTFTLQLPKYALYNDLYFEHSIISSPNYKYSPLIRLHNPLTPLHKKVKFELRSTNIPTKYRSKALFATFDVDKKIIAALGEWKDGFVKGLISNFGDYYITLDTLAPEIKPINVKSGSNMTGCPGMQITVLDDFSGVKKVDGYIDGNWVLFDYDKKNNLIYYQFDKERLSRNKNHKLEIVAVDNKDNESRFLCEFNW